jgi:leucyl aminopeptidase (aminopeptidase T)
LTSRGARAAVRTCLGIRKGEKVLIVTDPPKLRVAMDLFEECLRAGAETAVMMMRTLSRHGEEPPETVGRAMRMVDAVIAPTTYSITHTQARLQATLAGVRVATMPGITEEMMTRGAMLADYRKIERLTKTVARIREKGARVHITSRAGTDLTFDISGRKPHADTGILRKPGDFGNLPAGEVFIAPVEGTGEGLAVIDGVISSCGRARTEMEFRGGMLVRMRGNGKLMKILSEVGEPARNLAEFGVGTNERARFSGNLLEEEKILGTCHIALGDNSTFGGRVRAGVHIDCVMVKPTVEVDGRIILKDGRLLV